MLFMHSPSRPPQPTPNVAVLSLKFIRKEKGPREGGAHSQGREGNLHHTSTVTLCNVCAHRTWAAHTRFHNVHATRPPQRLWLADTEFSSKKVTQVLLRGRSRVLALYKRRGLRRIPSPLWASAGTSVTQTVPNLLRPFQPRRPLTLSWGRRPVS